MIAHVEAGDSVLEVATSTSWTVLYFDTALRIATCERRDGYVNIVRSLSADDLESMLPAEGRRCTERLNVS
jgi:hypothetical protein